MSKPAASHIKLIEDSTEWKGRMKLQTFHIYMNKNSMKILLIHINKIPELKKAK